MPRPAGMPGGSANTAYICRYPLAGTAIRCWMGKYGGTGNPAQRNGWRVLAAGTITQFPNGFPRRIRDEDLPGIAKVRPGRSRTAQQKNRSDGSRRTGFYPAGRPSHICKSAPLAENKRRVHCCRAFPYGMCIEPHPPKEDKNGRQKCRAGANKTPRRFWLTKKAVRRRKIKMAGKNAGRGQIKRREEFRLASVAVRRRKIEMAGEKCRAGANKTPKRFWLTKKAVRRRKIEMAGERLSGGDEQNAEKNFDWRMRPSAEDKY